MQKLLTFLAKILAYMPYLMTKVLIIRQQTTSLVLNNWALNFCWVHKSEGTFSDAAAHVLINPVILCGQRRPHSLISAFAVRICPESTFSYGTTHLLGE